MQPLLCLPAAGCSFLWEISTDTSPKSILDAPALSSVNALTILSWPLQPGVGLSAYPSSSSVVILGPRAVLPSADPEPEVLFTLHTPQMRFEHTDDC